MISVMTPTRKESAIAALRSAIVAIEAIPTVTPCSECLNFDKGYCTTWNAEVPESNRPAGCARWEQDVPF